MAAAAIFVISGLLYIALTDAAAISDADRLAGPLLPPLMTPGAAIPHLYLKPGNLVMWALLITVWGMIMLDAVGQWIEPSDQQPIRGGQARVWPMAIAALACAAAWPILIDRPVSLAIAASASAAFAMLGARRAAGRHRPAIGFFAGWATALAAAALAELATQHWGLPGQTVSAMAILAAAGLGMAAQIWIGASIGYSIALIWAFCGLAMSTMGSDPMIALAAILGISAMAGVLVRAAS